MEKLVEGLFTGERALYNIHNKEIIDSTFADGESPLKECSDLIVKGCIFKWKYPMWYSENIKCSHTVLLDTARSGIWYTHNIEMDDCVIEAPKTFRRSSKITIKNTSLVNAEETLWNCSDIIMENVTAKGNYLCLNSNNIKITNFNLVGNYAFDGAKNVEIRNAKMSSKDSFWNCENVVVYDSIIVGEYLGWNSKNVTFINCMIDSNQGMCYMENIKMVNCKLLNTDLCFEFCKDVDAKITTKIDSVKNPYNGVIVARDYGEIILDEKLVDPSKTKILKEEEQ